MRIGSVKLARPLDQVLKRKLEPYAFEVGILQDGPHKTATKGLKAFAGGPARRVGKKVDGTLSRISAKARRLTGINYLTRPFKNRNNDAVKMMRGFMDLVFKDGKLARKKRLENLIQAVVRNPILRGAYGRNRKTTSSIKGFNRKLIDTAQLFKAIRARVRFTKKAG